MKSVTMKCRMRHDIMPLSQWANWARSLFLGLVAAIVAVGVLVSMGQLACAADAAPAVAGSWRVAEAVEEKNARLQAIEKAIGDMPRFVRKKAQDRVSKLTTSPENLSITVEEGFVAIASDEKNLKVRLDAPPITRPGPNGKVAITATMQGEELVVTARGDKGGRTTVYRANGDLMTMQVTMKGEKFKGPLQYTATYARAK